MSCSKAFRKPESAEEERNLNENAIPKSTRYSDKVVSGVLLLIVIIQRTLNDCIITDCNKYEPAIYMCKETAENGVLKKGISLRACIPGKLR